MNYLLYFYVYINRKVHVVSKFNCVFKTESLLTVTVHCKYGNVCVSETVKDRVIATTNH